MPGNKGPPENKGPPGNKGPPRSEKRAPVETEDLVRVAPSQSVPVPESREEAQRRLRVEAVSEVMLHVADGRLEMAALMLRQAEADLERDIAGKVEWAKDAEPLRESLDAARKRLVVAIYDELKSGSNGQVARCCKLLCMVNQG